MIPVVWRTVVNGSAREGPEWVKTRMADGCLESHPRALLLATLNGGDI